MGKKLTKFIGSKFGAIWQLLYLSTNPSRDALFKDKTVPMGNVLPQKVWSWYCKWVLHHRTFNTLIPITGLTRARPPVWHFWWNKLANSQFWQTIEEKLFIWWILTTSSEILSNHVVETLINPARFNTGHGQSWSGQQPWIQIGQGQRI